MVFFGIIAAGGLHRWPSGIPSSATAPQGLDSLPPEAALTAIAEAQSRPPLPFATQFARIAEAAETVARMPEGGGRLAYAAAGSSGLMALADALEMPGTFGIARERIVILLAEGATRIARFRRRDRRMTASRASTMCGQLGLEQEDCLIAVSASGTTPYAVAALRAAKASGAITIAIANNAGTPLLDDWPMSPSCSPRRRKSSPARPAWARGRRRRSRST